MGNLREVAQAVEKRAARKLARGTIELALPIYEGQYGARYGVLDGERLAEFEAQGEGDYTADQATEAAAEFVADACRQWLARGVPGGPWEPLTHDDGRPVRFDQEVAEVLSLEAPEGRELDSMAAVVLACWTTDEGDVNAAALNAYAVKLLTWMQDTSRGVEGELVGGSNGTRP